MNGAGFVRLRRILGFRQSLTWRGISYTERVNLGTQFSGRAAGGHRTCQGRGQRVGRRGADEDRFVVAAGDFKLGRAEGLGGRGEGRGVAGEAGEGGVRGEVEKLPAGAFGVGQHQCIGRDFAMMEAQLILAMLFQRYRISAVPGSIAVPELSATLRPKNGVTVKLTAR